MTELIYAVAVKEEMYIQRRRNSTHIYWPGLHISIYLSIKFLFSGIHCAVGHIHCVEYFVCLRHVYSGLWPAVVIFYGVWAVFFQMLYLPKTFHDNSTTAKWYTHRMWNYMWWVNKPRRKAETQGWNILHSELILLLKRKKICAFISIRSVRIHVDFYNRSKRIFDSIFRMQDKKTFRPLSDLTFLKIVSDFRFGPVC